MTTCKLISDSRSVDPCYNYTVLDNPWRANNRQSYDHRCDTSFTWRGWYRLFLYGLNVRISDTCVRKYRCGTDIPLWIRDGHPRVEDGVVTRDVCGHWNNYCCYYGSYPIKVKACPGNYYVYELVRPIVCSSAYCADYHSADPCYNYTVLDEPWRTISNTNSHNCDNSVTWSGWYRFFINNVSAHIPDTCVARYSCGTDIPLWIRGGHPTVEDGVVTRYVCGHWENYCYYGSFPIKVKACPGNYYVYELVSPTFCNAAYCAGDYIYMSRLYMFIGFVFLPNHYPSKLLDASSINTSSTAVIPAKLLTDYHYVDPCYNYIVLDNPWRASNRQSYHHNCDTFTLRNWYRLFLYGLNVQISDTCVRKYRCSTNFPLWINGGHPTVEDGIVTRDVCAQWENYCCYYGSYPIKVKACPGNYYVYELVTPTLCSSAYCADISSINTSSIAAIPPSLLTDYHSADPCYNYTVLDDSWRVYNGYYYNNRCDTLVTWSGWYRLFINGLSAHVPDTCVVQYSCGTNIALWIRGGHPTVQDGVVTRDVCGHWNNYCCYYESYPIKIKACPDNYYVYELIAPTVCNSAYCADVSSINTSATAVTPVTISTDYVSFNPCYNYTVLDNPWRATSFSYHFSMCDTSVIWRGWYRLFINGLSAQIPETCVATYRCGTAAPLWLRGGHPTVEDGVVTRDACSHWRSDCCYYQSLTIKVKACPGNYYVYELPPSPTVNTHTYTHT
ncbi:Pancreatic secretory granule membrane major glycoprotein GP2 [Labeo rohita]|uniref:Pancreatic secretory granule membrane major glycoprotein GP2 n=1 Tax=Labeo rohita TaxID=84645 RepID=A0ABQ8N1I4_LABRO|nr:Pancreatic secretory granule membrane major glycoprotein GP2 [Labeo rohita]